MNEIACREGSYTAVVVCYHRLQFPNSLIFLMEYFHINRKVHWGNTSFWKEGEELEVGDSTNPFFSYYENCKLTFPVVDGEQVLESPAMTFLRVVEEGQVNCPTLPSIARKISQHFLVLARELYWERVREHEFPDRPSRLRCLWLAPSLESARSWLSRLECRENYQIVRISAVGKFHTANELLLIGDSEPLTTTYQRASYYWQGIIDQNSREEILFEGKLKVLEVVESG